MSRGSKPGKEANGYKHGMIGTLEYNSWQGMRRRCHNPNDPSYSNYGGRGIEVCERWRVSFENFLKDMGKAPSPDHSIDRYPSNDGNYEPGNCRWATKEEQLNNTRRNAYHEHNGETLTRAQLARKIGISDKTLTFRLNSGMTLEEATTKEIRQPQTYDYNGLTKTLREWADLYGMSYNVLYQRVRTGKTIAEALGT